jgi:hypothetical protein
MIKNRRIILWGAAVLVILASAGGWYYSYLHGRTEQEETRESIPVTNDVAASSLPYAQAVVIYAKERIQFNENCDIIPNPIHIKSGATMMFDNRSRDAMVFKLDGTGYAIPGYGFKLLQLKSTKLPHVVKVECGDNRNTGEIFMQ